MFFRISYTGSKLFLDHVLETARSDWMIGTQLYIHKSYSIYIFQNQWTMYPWDILAQNESTYSSWTLPWWRSLRSSFNVILQPHLTQYFAVSSTDIHKRLCGKKSITSVVSFDFNYLTFIPPSPTQSWGYQISHVSRTPLIVIQLEIFLIKYHPHNHE